MKNNANKKKKSKILAFLLWLIFGLFSFVIFVIFSLIIINNVTLFRKPTIQLILNIINSSLIAKIELDDIKIHSYDKLSIYKFNLITDGDTLAHFDKLYTSIKIADLLNNRITIRKLHLINLNIKILRNPIDSIWNYQKIAKGTEKKSTTGKSPIIEIKNLKIKNSRIIFFDKLSLNNEQYFNPFNLNIQKFNVELRALLDLDNAKSNFNLYNLSLSERVKDINIDSLRIVADLRNDELKLDSFLLLINNSKVNLIAQLKKFNPLNKKLNNRIEEAGIKLSANIQDFNPNLINKFVMVPFKDVEVDVKLNANGNLNELKVNNLAVSFNKSEINADVLLNNITNQKLRYDATLIDTKVFQRDVESLLSIDLTSVPKYEYALINKLNAVGTIYDVNGSGQVSTKAGSAEFEGGASWNKIIDYYINAQATGVNLATLFKVDALQSDLNGSVNAKGSGTSLDDLQVTANVNLSQSNFSNIDFSGLKSNIQIKNYDIILDTFNLSFPDKWDDIFLESNPQVLNVNGKLNIEDFNNPLYEIEMNSKNLDIASIIDNKNLPINFSCNFNLHGNSFNLDSMTAQINSEVSDLTFPSMSFMPFSFNLQTDKNHEGLRVISTGFMDDSITIIGNYSPNDLINTSLGLTNYIAEFANIRFNQFFKTEKAEIDTTKLDSLSKLLKLPEFEFNLYADFDNLTFLNNLIPNTEVNTSIEINGFGKSTNDNLFLDFSQTKIGESKITFDKLNLGFDDFIFNFSLNLTRTLDSGFALSFGNINIEELDKININNFSILKPNINLLSLENTFFVECGILYDSLLTSYIDIKGVLNKENIIIEIPSMNFSILNDLKFKNSSIAKINVDNNGFDIDEFLLSGNNGEEIDILGGISNNIFQNVKANIRQFNPFKYPKLISFLTKQELENIKLHLHNLEFLANGELSNPNYSINFSVDSLELQNYNFGILSGSFDYIDKNIIGNIKQTTYSNNQSLKVDITKLPIDLSLTENMGKFQGNYQFGLSLDSFQVAILQPFIPFISKLNGYANSSLEVNGSNFDDYQLNGNLVVANTNFLLLQNNLSYALNSEIDFSGNKIILKDLQINNQGIANSANVKGKILIEKNNVSNINLIASAKDFIILDDISQKALPQLYGRLSFSTKENQVAVTGNLENLIIDGSMQINPSNLTISNLSQGSQVVKTNFIYKKTGDVNNIIIESKDSNNNEITKKELKPISKKTNIPEVKLNFFVPRTINLKIDLGAIGEIVAILATSDPTVPVVFTMGKTAQYGQLTGELLIKNGSFLDSYKKMNAVGRIFFQSQDITNPYIALESSYKGKIDEDNSTIQYEVFININGLAQSPQVNFDYTINGVSPQGERKQIEENALYLLIFGRLQSAGIGSLLVDQSIVNKLSDAGISSLASRSLSDLLLKTGVIEGADFEINSQDFEKTKINFKGKLYGSVNWSLGGNIGDITRNNQIVLELPVSTNSEILNQVFWMLSYSTNLNTLTIDPDEKNWELKLKLGGSW